MVTLIFMQIRMTSHSLKFNDETYKYKVAKSKYFETFKNY
jgi:hypothetical protein